MAKITAIEPLRRPPGRWAVQVDGRTIANLERAVILELRLAVDQTWTETLNRQITHAQQCEKAIRAAITGLSRRALSSRQMAFKLRQRGFTDAVIHAVLQRLTDNGLLNDEALGLALIQEIRQRQASGPALLRDKLLHRGLERELVDRLIEQTSGDQNDWQAASNLAAKRWPSLAQLDPVKRRRRLWALLARRGFDQDVIERVMADMK